MLAGKKSFPPEGVNGKARQGEAGILTSWAIELILGSWTAFALVALGSCVGVSVSIRSESEQIFPGPSDS